MNRADVRPVRVLRTVWHNVPSPCFESLALVALQLSPFLHSLYKSAWLLSLNAGSGKTQARENQRMMWACLPLGTSSVPHIFMLVGECLTLGFVTRGVSQYAVTRTVMFQGRLPAELAAFFTGNTVSVWKTLVNPKQNRNPVEVPVSKGNKPGCASFPYHSFLPYVFIKHSDYGLIQSKCGSDTFCLQFQSMLSKIGGAFLQSADLSKIKWGVCRYSRFCLSSRLNHLNCNQANAGWCSTEVLTSVGMRGRSCPLVKHNNTLRQMDSENSLWYLGVLVVNDSIMLLLFNNRASEKILLGRDLNVDSVSITKWCPGHWRVSATIPNSLRITYSSAWWGPKVAPRKELCQYRFDTSVHENFSREISLSYLSEQLHFRSELLHYPNA